MRVVGGRHRGRVLAGPADDSVRPTSDRAREALFNILEHGRFSADGTSLLPGARVLDAFCGTGAFALEALSRGAAQATLIDRDAAALALARRNARALGETARTTFVQGDPTTPPPAPYAHDLAFLDPPYRSGLAAPALAALARAGWLAPRALCVAEIAAREDLAPPPGFETLDARRYGKAKLVFLRLT